MVRSLNVRRCDAAMATCASRAFIFGGTNELGDYLNTVEQYAASDDKWTMLGVTMSTARCRLGIVTWNNRVYLLGGRNADVECLSSVEYFTPADNRFCSLRIGMPNGRRAIAATLIGLTSNSNANFT